MLYKCENLVVVHASMLSNSDNSYRDALLGMRRRALETLAAGNRVFLLAFFYGPAYADHPNFADLVSRSTVIPDETIDDMLERGAKNLQTETQPQYFDLKAALVSEGVKSIDIVGTQKVLCVKDVYRCLIGEGVNESDFAKLAILKKMSAAEVGRILRQRIQANLIEELCVN